MQRRPIGLRLGRVPADCGDANLLGGLFGVWIRVRGIGSSFKQRGIPHLDQAGVHQLYGVKPSITLNDEHTQMFWIFIISYAAEMGPRISEFFEKFFQIDFPLPKQDMTSVPDFTFGAMENWGLITYRY